MAEGRPQMDPGGASSGGMSGAESMPSRTPPTNVSSSASTESPAPSMGGGNGAAPSLPLQADASEGVSAWQNNKRITALWSINQDRNSWVGIDGVGWRKLANGSDSAIVALTMLGAHAREKNAVVNYREESDGMVHEMYVW